MMYRVECFISGSAVHSISNFISNSPLANFSGSRLPAIVPK